MAEQLPLELPDNPKLAGNITHFARALRRAGLPIGPGRVIDAIRAVEAAGFSEKREVEIYIDFKEGDLVSIREVINTKQEGKAK